MNQQTKFNISEAARVTGKGRSTIHRYIKSGELSCGSNGNGIKFIDAAELIRVFGELKNPDTSPETSRIEPEKQRGTSETVSGLRQKSETLEQQVKELRKDKEDLKQDKELYRQENERLLGIVEQQTRLLPSANESPKRKRFFQRLFNQPVG